MQLRMEAALTVQDQQASKKEETWAAFTTEIVTLLTAVRL